MNSERWQQVKKMLDGALALASGERSIYLEHACGEDSELRNEVEALLHHHQLAGASFLNQPAVDLQRPLTDSGTMPLRIGRSVGVYQILEEIGRGGMGAVYRAARVDGQYEKQVAVKFVRGGYDTASVLERFRHERQILASLDHPNIARLLDGGTTEDGIPYLVMELIEGTPIDHYCDAHSLNVTQRLKLFCQVCSAVQYAHQHLVIHRDIKPSNVLVSSEGIPKLLDFGIAKILDPSVNSQPTLVHPLTPEYASPEQIRGEPITTSTDEYSLGVVLYQLLTGCSPYRVNTSLPHELSCAITETEPQRPSAVVLVSENARPSDHHAEVAPARIPLSCEGPPAKLHRRLAGDLDNIVLKAMRKEPQRRYGSVEQFAEDIRRHLDGLPVTARQDSWSYRAGKFIRRHTAAVAATLIVIITLAIGMAVTLREKRIAERRFNDVRKLANSLIFEVHDSIRDLPGSTAARKLLVSRGLEYLDSLNQQAQGDASLQKELAAAYERVGDVLGHPYSANLGDTTGALQSYRKALNIRESLAAARPSDEQLRGELAGNYFRIANVLESTGDLGGALDAVRKALPITQLMAAGTNSPAVADQFAGSYYFTAGLLGQMGDPAGALENYQRAASIREAALRIDSSNGPLRTHLAADYSGMALSVKKKGDLAQAVQMQEKAVQILEEVSQAHPNNGMLREYLAEAINRFAGFRKDQGDEPGALEAYRRAHQIFQDLLAADPKNSLAKANVAFSANGIGETLVVLGKPDSAVEIFREALATFQEMSPTTGNRYVRTALANTYSGLGHAFSTLATARNIPASDRRQKWREARSWYEKGLGVWIDKDKRAELESDEREELQIATQNIARCDSALLGVGAAGQR